MLRLIEINTAPAAGLAEADAFVWAFAGAHPELAAAARVFDWPVWECAAWPDPAGRFEESRWWESRPGAAEERCYITSGRAKLWVTREGEGGEPVVLTIQAGDRVVFRSGFRCTWEVEERIAKHYAYFDAEGRGKYYRS